MSGGGVACPHADHEALIRLELNQELVREDDRCLVEADPRERDIKGFGLVGYEEGWIAIPAR